MGLTPATRRRCLAPASIALIVLTAWLIIADGDRPRRRLCRANLEAIGMALRQYHTDFGSFPPAYVNGPDGRPMHSWRVLILPQLGERALYNSYDFREAWDGPMNRKLIRRMPGVYSCPAHGDSTHVDYAAIVGKGTGFPDAGMGSVSDCPIRGTSGGRGT
jgi:hypothetical protein